MWRAAPQCPAQKAKHQDALARSSLGTTVVAARRRCMRMARRGAHSRRRGGSRVGSGSAVDRRGCWPGAGLSSGTVGRGTRGRVMARFLLQTPHRLQTARDSKKRRRGDGAQPRGGSAHGEGGSVLVTPRVGRTKRPSRSRGCRQGDHIRGRFGDRPRPPIRQRHDQAGCSTGRRVPDDGQGVSVERMRTVNDGDVTASLLGH